MSETGAETLTIPELDQRTKDELQPPCESWTRRNRQSPRIPCGESAEWYITYSCGICGQHAKELICAGHFQRMSLAEPYSWVVCGSCGEPIEGFEWAVRL